MKLYIGNKGWISDNPKTIVYNKYTKKWEEVDAIPTELTNIPSQNADERDDVYYWFTITESPIQSQIGKLIQTNNVETLVVLQQLGLRWDNQI